MHKSLLILFCLFISFHSNAQLVLKERGALEWKMRKGVKPPEELQVKLQSTPLVKEVIPKKEKDFFSRDLDPRAKVILKGSVKPKRVKADWVQVDLKADESVTAGIFYFRDNAAFNVIACDKSHGLFHNSVNEVAEDESGNIWMATGAGLVRYDGFNQYFYSRIGSSRTNTVEHLRYQKGKGLWVVGTDGIFLIANEKVFSLTINGLRPLGSKNISIDRNGHVLVSTLDHGIFELLPDRSVLSYDKECGLPGNSFYCAYRDARGDLWATLQNVGLLKIAKDKVLLFFGGQDAAELTMSFFEDGRGLWMGSFNSGLYYFSTKDTLQFSPSGSYKERIYSFAADRSGFWFSIYGAGVVHFNGRRMLRINENNGLIDRHAFSLLTDSRGNVWVSDPFSGVSVIRENVFYPDEHYPDFIKSAAGYLKGESGTNWIFSNGAPLTKEYPDRFVKIWNKDMPGFQTHYYLLDGVEQEDGKLWCGSYGLGMVEVGESSIDFYRYSGESKDEVILQVEKTADSSIWFTAMNFALIKRDSRTGRFYKYTRAQGLSDDQPASVLASGKDLYCGYSGSIQKISGNEIRDLKFPDNFVTTDYSGMFKGKDGSFFFWGTAGGLSVEMNGKLFSVEDLSRKWKTVISMTQSGRNYWVSTGEGIFCFSMEGNKISGYRFYSSGHSPLLGKLVGLNFVADDGIPRFPAHKGGILTFDSAFSKVMPPPQINVRGILVNGKKVDRNNRLILKPDDRFELLFSAVNWGNEGLTGYRVVMVSENGRDTTFFDAGKAGKFVLPGISSGNYKVLLMAENPEGKTFSGEIVQMDMEPFWYNAPRTYIFVLIVLVMAGSAYYNKRIERQDKLNELLEKKVAERTEQLFHEKKELERSNEQIIQQNREKDALIHEIHHRVKNNLQYISAILGMQMKASGNVELIKLLSDTSGRINAMAIVHELLYSNEKGGLVTADDFMKKLCYSIKEMAAADSLPVRIDVASDNVVIDMNRAVAIGMIVSELISNSVKHAFRGVKQPSVFCTLGYDAINGEISIGIADNGSGKLPEVSDSGLGRRLVDIFARQLKAKYRFDDTDGVKFEMTFDYREPK